MKALIVSFKRGRHLIHPKQAIIKIAGIEDKGKAGALIGKKVVYKTTGGKEMTGSIIRVHGGNGLVRARFDKGLPGQAIGQEVTLK